MEFVRNYEKHDKTDLKKHDNLHPINGEGCVGKSGIDKTYTLDMVMKLAYKMPDKPNIIIKAGKNAKWYIKQCPVDEIYTEIEKMRYSKFWKDALLATTYIIEWID